MNDLGPTSHSFISQRLRLHYVDWGNPEAPPLILQHGGRDHCRSWDWVAQRLRHDWHVIAPDLRGHGDSAWSPDGDYRLISCVYDFAQLVQTLGYDQVTIIAHSLGGHITSRYVGLYPERVARYVNIEGLGYTAEDLARQAETSHADRMRKWITERRGAAGRQPRRYATLEEAYQRMKEANSYLSDEQARHLTVHGASRNEDGSWSWKYDNYLFTAPPDELGGEEIFRLWQAITCPVLLLWGADSWASSPAEDGRMAHFANARLITYEQAGHWLHHDRLDSFIADVTAFLAA
ncbi:alpha/beta fold hydrolase [Novosphingobium piscinae]|uniref:Alpha/beta hydrolase n=1 Tax=Novosphingobium piscinae TaxID=1507448 RepID=A0A7X1G071_9SPHN|nr:alpha/beta hydrolase [Novosphingobium piscinae]MBC2669577.1 alpha/beta hydrolase [Novosphingobium piscinae]